MAKVIRKLSVDTWKTGLKGKEIGINQQEQYMAKSRQYTKDMDLFGDIKEDGVDGDSGSVGIRKSIKDERIVIKAFTGKMNWMGTVEELVGEEISRSLILKTQFSILEVIIPRYPYNIRLEKVFGGPIRRETYHFTLFTENKEILMFDIEEQRVSIGKDWDVHNAQGKRVARLDGKKFDVGGQTDIEIFNEELAKNSEFVTTLILFCAFLRYEGDVEDRIKKLRESMEKGKNITLDNDELDLYKNPRAKLS